MAREPQSHLLVLKVLFAFGVLSQPVLQALDPDAQGGDDLVPNTGDVMHPLEIDSPAVGGIRGQCMPQLGDEQVADDVRGRQLGLQLPGGRAIGGQAGAKHLQVVGVGVHVAEIQQQAQL